MRRFNVEIAAYAEDQIDAAGQYIAQRSTNHADAWLTRVYDAIVALRDSYGFAVDEDASRKFGFEVRRYVFERTYLIFYRIDEIAGRIDVIEFRHGAREPS